MGYMFVLRPCGGACGRATGGWGAGAGIADEVDGVAAEVDAAVFALLVRALLPAGISAGSIWVGSPILSAVCSNTRRERIMTRLLLC